jgi:hypothetical protein
MEFRYEPYHEPTDKPFSSRVRSCRVSAGARTRTIPRGPISAGIATTAPRFGASSIDTKQVKRRRDPLATASAIRAAAADNAKGPGGHRLGTRLPIAARRCAGTTALAGAIDAQLAHRVREQPPLSCAGENDWRRGLDRRHAPQRRQARFAGVLDISLRCVGNDDRRGARGGFDRAVGGHAGAEAFDRRRLLDIERLAAGDCIVGVDEPHGRHAPARRQPVRQRSANRASADDRDEGHRSRLFY